MTIAIGSPLRVTRIDFPVFLTLSNKRRQVALNFEMGIVSCIFDLVLFERLIIATVVIDHGQLIFFMRTGMME